MQWKVTVEAAGYSRGTRSAIVEAATADEAKALARDDAEWGPVDIVRDDREIDWDWMTAEEWQPLAREGARDIINDMRAAASSDATAATQLRYFADRIEAALA